MKVQSRRKNDKKIEIHPHLDSSFGTLKSSISGNSIQPSSLEHGDSQQKITKLREALSLTQEYADSIIGARGNE